MIKKLISTSIIIIFLFTITGCTDRKQPAVEETTTQYITETYNQITNETTTFFQSAEQTTIINTPETTTAISENLTDDQIIELYVNAAVNSHATAKSVQKISMKDFNIDNGGAINSIMKMFLPVISKVVESNSTEFDGITGGYNNLCIDDITEISYTKTNETTNIKIKLKDQISSGTCDINSGTVGHGISVIGDLSSVFNQLKNSGIPISVENYNIVLSYKNAQIDVTVDKNGKITNGVWSYDVTLDLNNFSVGGTVVPNASVVISNQITTNN